MSHRTLTSIARLAPLLALLAACDPSVAPGPVVPDTPSVDRLVFEGGTDAEVHFRRNGETLLVLVNGAGFDRRIWSQTFAGTSMLAYFLQYRYAVALLDLPGQGAGMQRPGGTITLAAQAAALHASLGQLKGRFPRMICLGMTSGALVVVRAQADYADCAGVVVQSWTPAAHPSNITQVDADLFTNPANADVDGYVRVPKGIRDKFYNAAHITQEAVAADRNVLTVQVPVALASAWIKSFDDVAESHVGALTGPVLAQYGLGDNGLAPVGQWPAGVHTVKSYGDLGTVFDLHVPTVASKTRDDIRTWIEALGFASVRR